MFDAAFAQPLQNWFLRRLARVQQSVIHVARLFTLSPQTGRAAQISLVSEYNEKFCLLAIGCVFRHPRRNLAGWTSRYRKATPSDSARLRRGFGGQARGGDGSYGSDDSRGEEQ